MGHPPGYVTFSAHLSVCSSVAHHIWGTIHHLLIIVVTHVWNDVSRGFFHFFKILIFWVVSGVIGEKMAQNGKKTISATLHISGSIHHVIMILGCLGGKRAKYDPKWQKKLALTLYLKNDTSYDLFLIHMCKIMISPAIFLFFQNSDFLGF